MTPERAAELARALETHIRWSEGFWIGYVFAPARRDALDLIDHVGEWLRGRGATQRVRIAQSAEDVHDAVAWVLDPAGVHATCSWVEGVELDPPDAPDALAPWRSAWRNLVGRLNERRERLRAALHGGLVLVAPTGLKPLIRSAGPDLWSIRSVLVELPEADGGGKLASAVAAERARSTSTRLTADELRGLVDLAVDTGLGDRRSLLMHGLPPAFVASLPRMASPRDQVIADLQALNATERLLGLDTPPLAVWLENAGHLLAPQVEAARLRDLRDRVRHRATVPELTNPTNVPAEASAEFFIAYPSLERPAAKALTAALRRRGHHVFLDVDSLRPGDAWDVEIPRAQREARVTVVLVSPRANDAWYHREEVAAAVARARAGRHRVVPVHLDGPASPEYSVYGLGRLQALSMTERGVDGVAEALSDLLPRAEARFLTVSVNADALETSKRLWQGAYTATDAACWHLDLTDTWRKTDGSPLAARFSAIGARARDWLEDRRANAFAGQLDLFAWAPLAFQLWLGWWLRNVRSARVYNLYGGVFTPFELSEAQLRDVAPPEPRRLAIESHPADGDPAAAILLIDLLGRAHADQLDRFLDAGVTVDAGHRTLLRVPTPGKLRPDDLADFVLDPLSIIHRLRREGVRRFHLGLCAPGVAAFALGRELHGLGDAVGYEYDGTSDTYHRAMRLVPGAE